ncbi:MAG: tetratricopeptide repeat protein [Armatimonadetes bacterium]|nr:tetratricopeptide repeat protein [Armatimonadota bacterium]MCX7968412.1 tetratricopeptide repeat protein [Armatimonadota bacterium]MDW8143590.1 tetratricopeptide repeat protein [Armatimonadota bacterium]
MATFCRHCGNAIGDGVERCSHCGASLNGKAIEEGEKNLPSEPANKLPETSPEDLLAQAMKLADEGAYDDAILVCRRAIGLREDFVAAYAFLGELYERVGEPQKALAAYEKALALDKDYEPAKLGKERLSKTPPPPAPKPSPEPSSWVWMGHPLPLLGATALVVSLLFAVRMIAPPVPRSSPVPPQPPITLAPSPQSPAAPATVPPLPAVVDVALKRGMEALNAQKYDEAIRWFERALQFAPNNNEARSWLLIARAMKEEAQPQTRPPVVVARPENAPLPVLPSPSSREQSPTSQTSSRSSRPSQQHSTGSEFRQPQVVQVPTSPAWAWQPQWGSTSPMMPQASQPSQFTPQRQNQYPIVPTLPQSPALPSPTEKPPTINPQPSSPPNIPPMPMGVEDMERQASQKVYEGDLAGAAQIYRTMLSQGVGIEREGYIRQQLALTLQQLRRYDEAAEEYEKAIAAYKRQIEQGINTAAAQRGIEACQRGLEICRRAR